MTIERDIQDLLREHDLVIVPGFGGLLGQRHPARIDEARRLIHPPAKATSFNRNLVRNDGLLADHIASRRTLPHAEALAVIEGCVKAWRASLAQHGRVEVPGIGTFFHDAEKNLQFEPDPRAHLLKDAYGLRSLPAVPVPATIAPPVLRPAPVIAPVERNGERRVPVLWAAAAATGILFAFGGWFLAGDRMHDRLQLGSFNPFGPAIAARYVPPSDAPEAFQPLESGSWSVPEGQSGVQALPIAGPRGPLVRVDLGMPAPADAGVVYAPDKTRVVVDAPRSSRFHVIGGCFSVKENADRFLSDLQVRGFQAVLVDQHRGLYRVAYGSYPDRSVALEALATLRREGDGEAWLLVR